MEGVKGTLLSNQFWKKLSDVHTLDEGQVAHGRTKGKGTAKTEVEYFYCYENGHVIKDTKSLIKRDGELREVLIFGTLDKDVLVMMLN